MSSPSLALANLRTFVIVIVLAVHSALAYLGSNPPSQYPFDKPPYGWQSIPIVDNERWLGFDVFCAHQDVYLITLLFFLSGLFVWPSLIRKGGAQFMRDRLLRIALPFALAVGFLSPVAVYAIYRVTAADPDIVDFFEHFLALPFWPSGPPWFLWVLLVLNFAAVAVFLFARRWGEALGRWSAHPGPYLVGLISASALAYVPLALAFTPWQWADFGPFAIELSRPLHYAVYFFAGVGIGAGGIDRGLLAADGLLARLWRRWMAAAFLTFATWLGITAFALASDGQASSQPSATIVPLGIQFAQAVAFALACGANCLLAVALFLRFANKRVAALELMRDNAYGMYLVHYVFSTWTQYLLLGSAILAIVKWSVGFAATLVLSFAATAAIRSLPAGARLIGTRARIIPRTP